MRRLKICVCTSNAASAEPRAPKHAVALAKMGEDYEIIFLDCVRRGEERLIPEAFSGMQNITYHSYYFPHRKDGLPGLIFEKLRYLLSRGLFSTFGLVTPSAVSTRAAGLAASLRKIEADVYIAHTIDSLPAVCKVAQERNAVVIFDCQEFYSDMGDGQSRLDREIIRRIESRCLPACNLVLTVSDQLADELVRAHGLRRPLPLYNVPPLQSEFQEKESNEFTLYWRNSTIDLGQRGLDDALLALKSLPDEIILHIQGNLPRDRGGRMKKRIENLDLVERVVFHLPYPPHQAVRVASLYEVGLCMEQPGYFNAQVAAPNKIFDYFMAGLAVVASDLPGLRQIITRSGGGLLYKSGCPDELAEKLMLLYRDRQLLSQLARNARSFAIREGNSEHEMKKLESAFHSLIQTRNKRIPDQ